MGEEQHLGRGSLAPFIPSPLEAVYEALSLAGVGEGDVLYDLGCGDGRVVVIAARDFGVRLAIGVEIDPALVAVARYKAREQHVDSRVEVIEGDLLATPLRNATVVYIYLYASINERLAPKLSNELKPGARVVTLDFPIPLWTPVRVRRFEDSAGRIRTIYLYVRGVSDAEEVRVKRLERLEKFLKRLKPSTRGG